jgi:replicative DNA helicase
MRGISTGLQDLDTLTEGLQGADLAIVVTPSSVSPMSLTLRIALHVAMTNLHGVGFLSLDMHKNHIVQRLLAMRTGIDLHRLRTGEITDEERPLVIGTARTLSKARLWIDDRSGPTLPQLRQRARQLAEEHGVALLTIDNLHQIQISAQGTPQRNRLQEVGEIGLSLKRLAQELSIPIVVEAPLPRALVNHHAKRPRSLDTRPDLREQAVDQVLFLSRDLDSGTATERTSRVTIIIAGHRHGAIEEWNHFIQLR